MSLTHALGARSTDHGVRVVGVNPGLVETDRMTFLMRTRAETELGDPERWRELLPKLDLPYGRPAAAEEVANVVVFLASERASYLSGDVVRVEAPADRIFMPGSNYLQNGAEQLLVNIGADLRQNFPDNIIGIEGHTDPPTSGALPTTAHQLSAAQAYAVFEQLSMRSRMPSNQLFVVSQGVNRPRFSNETPAGRAKNRRIELVIYPETTDGR